TPGERTSCDTTTRSVPLTMNVPLGVMSGKSPMNTVWDLISPVSLLMNSAVTNSGAEYVKSRILHSSMLFFGSSNRGFENDRDIVPEKSSMGLISSRVSCNPDVVLMSVRPSASAAATRACQRSFPSSQSKLSIWRARRLGTSRGSLSLAKERRRELFWVSGAVGVTANRGPSEGTRMELIAWSRHHRHMKT